MFDLTGKRALVTGGNRGIGYAIAQALGRAGAEVAIANRSAEEGQRAAERLGAKWLGGDVGRADAARELVRQAIELLGGLDILVNNAGQIDRRPALEVDDATWDRLLAVNLKGVFHTSAAATRHMKDQGGGKIINLSSVAARLAIAGRTVYGPTKAAVSQLTRVLAVEWAPYGIQVNAIAPGWVRTDLNSAWLDEDPERYQRILESIPAGRLGNPQDIGGLAVFLASPASGYLTGQTIEIDGGLGLG